MTARYIGLSRTDGRTLTDADHISQSLSDILRTPIGSRVMRRDYGSPLGAKLDQPPTPPPHLQIMVACYMAILKWEPRISVTAVTTERQADGKMIVNLTGQHADTGESLSLTLPVR